MVRNYVRQNVVNRYSHVLANVATTVFYSHVLANVATTVFYSHVLANVATTVCFFKFRRNSSRDIRLRKILISTINNPGQSGKECEPNCDQLGAEIALGTF